MKRKLSCTAIVDADTQQCQYSYEAYGERWKMSEHQHHAVDCKGPPIPINAAVSPTAGNCSTSLMQDNLLDSETIHTGNHSKEMPIPLVSSSATSTHFSDNSTGAETEASAVIGGDFMRNSRHSDAPYTEKLDHSPLTVFFASSPSNYCPASRDCVSFQPSSIYLGYLIKKHAVLSSSI